MDATANAAGNYSQTASPSEIDTTKKPKKKKKKKSQQASKQISLVATLKQEQLTRSAFGEARTGAGNKSVKQRKPFSFFSLQTQSQRTTFFRLRFERTLKTSQRERLSRC